MQLFRGEAVKIPSGDEGWFKEKFPTGKYEDVEGLCKIVDLEEVADQDYSLTPGRYVGVVVTLDMDFDYQGRMTEIHSELATLNEEANTLMQQIQNVGL
jgi:type I restriction enzyme M protein